MYQIVKCNERSHRDHITVYRMLDSLMYANLFAAQEMCEKLRETHPKFVFEIVVTTVRK